MEYCVGLKKSGGASDSWSDNSGGNPNMVAFDYTEELREQQENPGFIEIEQDEFDERGVSKKNKKGKVFSFDNHSLNNSDDKAIGKGMAGVLDFFELMFQCVMGTDDNWDSDRNRNKNDNENARAI